MALAELCGLDVYISCTPSSLIMHSDRSLSDFLLSSPIMNVTLFFLHLLILWQICELTLNSFPEALSIQTDDCNYGTDDSYEDRCRRIDDDGGDDVLKNTDGVGRLSSVLAFLPMSGRRLHCHPQFPQ